MPKPLRSENPQPRDMQFTHFGVLNAGAQSKSSLFTSITVNVLLALIIVIIGAAARKKIVDNRVKEVAYVPLNEKPPDPPKPPKPPPPKIVPPKPVPPPPTPPKIVLPAVKLPDPPKVEVPVPKPTPPMMPAPPKLAVAAAAPKPVAVNLGRDAAVPNHDAHPSAVSLGTINNPIAPSNRPAVAAIDLGHTGMQGMPPGSGRGPNASAVSLGSGQPDGRMGGKAGASVVGVSMGCAGCTGKPGGNSTGTSPQQVTGLARATPPPALPTSIATKAPVQHAPVVTFKPRPVYTAEATALHLEGVVSVRIHVAASGAVSVLGVTSGLGHGLDESAVRAAQGIRFKPAVDSSGNPTDWEGTVTITFQLA